MHAPLIVAVHDEKGTMFEGEAVAVSSMNETGPFDILSQHSNFITIIRKSVVIHLKDATTKEFSLESGVLRCYQAHIEIYLGTKM